MSYRHEHRLRDIQRALEAIQSHLDRGGLDDGLVFDGVRMRIIEIGEAVKSLPPELLAEQPGIAWGEIARMRDHLAHRYFDTTFGVVADVVRYDVIPLREAVGALLTRLASDGASATD
ncbi:DUF86 domain-containing protein [Spongisporangium articulatum]|uniref:DUF86 domain-containing protein n=1 Tax=Spongisporangium articulatum TaxID=3362603 RepID=A0ABW8AJS4_9ACTN